MADPIFALMMCRRDPTVMAGALLDLTADGVRVRLVGYIPRPGVRPRAQPIQTRTFPDADGAQVWIDALERLLQAEGWVSADSQQWDTALSE